MKVFTLASRILPRRRLHQKRRDAARPAAHGHDPRPRLAAGADFRDVDTGLNEPRMGGVDVSEVRTGRKPGTRVMTVRSGTCGVPTLLVQPSAGPPTAAD